MIIILLVQGIVFSARIVKFVVESVVTGSAIGQSLLGSGKGVGQSGPFTVGNRPCDIVAGTIGCCVSLAALNDVEAGSGVTIHRHRKSSEMGVWWRSFISNSRPAAR